MKDKCHPAALLLSLFIAAPTAAGETCKHKLSLTAFGTAETTADYLQFDIQATGQGPTLQAARAQVAQKLESALQILRYEAGADPAFFKYASPRETRLRQDGQNGAYSATRSVEIRASGFAGLSRALIKISKHVEIAPDDFSFGVADQDAARDTARTAAYNDTQRRAQAWAKASSTQLGDMLEIKETHLTLVRNEKLPQEAALSGLPIIPGTVPLSVTAYITWCLNPVPASSAP